MTFVNRSCLSVTLVLLGFCGDLEAQVAKSEPVNFAREILPILSDKCFACHGPDTHDADMLRLDSFEAATKDRGGYFALDTKQPKNSEVLKRILSADDPMPPTDAEKQLTAEEKQLLSRWIEQGGKYEKHWAFVSPWASLSPDELKQPNSNAIDTFIHRRMKKQNVDFAPEADLATLARRASLILTGLPPEPERIEKPCSKTNAMTPTNVSLMNFWPIKSSVNIVHGTGWMLFVTATRMACISTTAAAFIRTVTGWSGLITRTCRSISFSSGNWRVTCYPSPTMEQLIATRLRSNESHNIGRWCDSLTSFRRRTTLIVLKHWGRFCSE